MSLNKKIGDTAMKKSYIAPVTKLLTLLQTNHLLAGSPSSRSITGGPASQGLRSNVIEDFDIDGLTNGQDGGSTRSREIGDIWDDEE